MQAIQTIYRNPTNHNGPRIRAVCDAGAVVVEWDHGLSVERNHQVAAQTLVRSLGWAVANGYVGEWVGGSLPDGSYVWVLTRGAAGFTA